MAESYEPPVRRELIDDLKFRDTQFKAGRVSKCRRNRILRRKWDRVKAGLPDRSELGI